MLLVRVAASMGLMYDVEAHLRDADGKDELCADPSDVPLDVFVRPVPDQPFQLIEKDASDRHIVNKSQILRMKGSITLTGFQWANRRQRPYGALLGSP